MRHTFNNYSNQVIDGKMSIWLQQYGWAASKPAEDFKPGEFMKWNTGSESKVVAVAIQSAKTITYILEYKGYDGKYEQGLRKFVKSRQVAIGSGKYY